VFVTKNQFYVFVACLAFGTVLALLYSVVRLVRYVFNSKVLLSAIDLLFLAFSGLLFSYYSHMLFFPNFRPYMLIGVFSGFFGYLKSFHILLAKTIKKFYNIIVNKIPKKRRTKNDQ